MKADDAQARLRAIHARELEIKAARGGEREAEVRRHSDAMKDIDRREAADIARLHADAGAAWLRWHADAGLPVVATVSGAPAVFIGVRHEYFRLGSWEDRRSLLLRGRGKQVEYTVTPYSLILGFLKDEDRLSVKLGLGPWPETPEDPRIYTPTFAAFCDILAGKVPPPIGEAPAPSWLTPPPTLEKP